MSQSHTLFGRIAEPLLLFSLALSGLLLLSSIFLLPRLTRFAVEGTNVSPVDIAAHVRQLRADLSSLESKRNHLVLPELDPAYNMLKEQKRTSMNLSDVRTELLQAAAKLSNADHAVFLTHFSSETTTHTITVTGDVRNVGTRSMTVLAGYVDAVAALPFVTHLERPAFTREGDEKTGLHSPFMFHFILTTALAGS